MDEPKDSGAVAYLRRSRVDENRTGAVSYEAQQAAVEAMAGRWGYGKPRLLVDWGRSGGSEKRRPSYLELRGLIESDAVRDVFAYDLSRLTRSLEEWVRLATLCRDHGVRVHLSKEGDFDFTTASGEMLANILASVAQAVRRWASERSTETVTSLRARGQSIGRKPYGTRPGEDLEAVKAAYIEAGTYPGAARLLNARGLPTLKGKAWISSSVSWIIRHQAPELASGATRSVVRQAESRYVLSRLVRCSCGRTLSPYSYANGRNPHYTVYRCPSAQSLPGHPRPYAVSEAGLLAWAKAEAAHLRVPPEVQLDTDNREAERAALEAKRVRIVDMFADGTIDKPERLRRLAEVDAALEAIDHQTRAASIVAVPELDWTWPPSVLNRVLAAIWDHVEVDEQMRPLEAVWRVPEWRQSD
jgi:DNA invertase Pin-like site-specific DNA recombinase